MYIFKEGERFVQDNLLAAFLKLTEHDFDKVVSALF